MPAGIVRAVDGGDINSASDNDVQVRFGVAGSGWSIGRTTITSAANDASEAAWTIRFANDDGGGGRLANRYRVRRGYSGNDGTLWMRWW